MPRHLKCRGGAGIEGERSGLWSEMARIIGEIRPKFSFVENSPMLTLRGLGRVLGDLSEMGYNARWGVLGADAAGLRHHRARMWVVADSTARRWKQREPNREAARNFGFMGERSKPGTNPEWIKAEPGMVGMGDVLANRVDRLFSIGNGQVPAVAALAFRILGGGK